jgi:cyclic pyranopterin phosphate synthase
MGMGMGVDSHAGAGTGGEVERSALVDGQQRRIDYLRVSVTDRCNYRCTYCLPETGVPHAARAEVLTFEETVRLVSCFARLGVRRLRLTGGEPTVRRDLPVLVGMLRAIPGVEDIALSTNGHLLGDLAEPLFRAGVTRLNVSLDTLDPGRFAAITRGGDLARVLDGLERARRLGFASIKINTVAVRDFNHGELGELCAFAWDRGLVPRFIEQMPMSDGALFVPGRFMSAAEIRAEIQAGHPAGTLVADEIGRRRGAGPARYWRIEVRGARENESQREVKREGEKVFGIISPITEHFCEVCNRVRLSATGALHTCLAYDDAVDLRGVLASGGESGVLATIAEALVGKRPKHGFGLLGIGGPRKAMIQIGG